MIEKRWKTAAGFEGIVAVNDHMGFRLGYVVIDEPLAKWLSSPPKPDWRTRIPLLRRWARDTSVWESRSDDLRCHGGVTMCGFHSRYKEWLVGFDCGHFMDGSDPDLMTSEEGRYLKERDLALLDGTVRSAEYVEAEVEELAAQIEPLTSRAGYE